MAAVNVKVLVIYKTPCIYFINAENSTVMIDDGSKLSKLYNDMSQANICEILTAPKSPIVNNFKNGRPENFLIGRYCFVKFIEKRFKKCRHCRSNYVFITSGSQVIVKKLLFPISFHCKLLAPQNKTC